MLPQEKLRVARIIASVAATFISLACGTNYVYSAWAPQFAVRLKLSATESNLIGLAGNLGMYTMGVPVGMVVDKRPRPVVLAGSVLLALGYFPLHISYQNAAGSVPLMCLCSYLSGLGGCMAFAAAVKTSALNWPHHRGTATAFPLAAFGLSAFFFSALGSILARDPSEFLMLLAVGTFGITFVGFFFLKVYPHQSYHAVNKHERSSSLTDSQQLRRTSTSESKPYPRRHPLFEPGTSSNATNTTISEADNIDPAALEAAETVEPPRASGHDGAGGSSSDNDSDVAVDETSSLMSSSTEEEGREIIAGSIDMDRSHRVDIRGFKLLQDVEFWQLFSIMGILAGVGLMTINNIGNDAKALWEKYDPNVEDPFLVKIQQLHVSILSIGSFAGRLASGVGSDMLVKRLNASRVWCLVIACFIFFFAQVCALVVTNPHLLGFVSGLSGLGYGFAFGVFPSIVAETFGIRGLSQNWGFMTLAPVVSGNIFNLFYGATYDHHSIKKPDGERVCMEGLECYRAAYVVTLGACAAGVLVTLLTIRHQHAVRVKEQMKADEED